jgi:hypothetical protein
MLGCDFLRPLLQFRRFLLDLLMAFYFLGCRRSNQALTYLMSHKSDHTALG